MRIEINQVEFAKRGRNQAGKTYTAGVFGIPEFNDDGEFIGLNYADILKSNPREAEIREILETKEYDIIECLILGHDVISKRDASAATSLKRVFLDRLMSDGYCPNLSGKDKQVRLNAFAAAMIGNLNAQDCTPDEAYAEFVEKLKSEFRPIVQEPAVV